MIKKVCIGCAAAVLILAGMPAASAPRPVPQVDITGHWDVEIDAGGEYYYLTMNIKKADTGLQITVSESNGMFTDVPASDVKYEGENLSFNIFVPTPPDGVERRVDFSLAVSESTMSGTLNIPDLQMMAAVACSRMK